MMSLMDFLEETDREMGLELGRVKVYIEWWLKTHYMIIMMKKVKMMRMDWKTLVVGRINIEMKDRLHYTQLTLVFCN
jgi:hypothetical protein